MILFHPHALHNIMAKPKAAGEVLSVGAKTYIEQLAKEHVYGYREQITSKYMEKGLMVEDQSIELFNSVFFTDYRKNTQRVTSDILTGEADIVDDDLIIDIKSSWSLATFPATQETAHKSEYEWQGRAYMMLYGKPKFTLSYCLVSTPEELIRYEQEDLHFVDHIPAHMRITTVDYDRDLEIEKQIEAKCKAGQQYFAEIVDRINKCHMA